MLFRSLICLPLHLFFLPRNRAGAGEEASAAADIAEATVPADPPRHAGRAAFRWLAASFALAALLSAALSVHVITLLKDAGLAARDAVLVSALIGPMQVAGRIAEFVFMRRVSPLAVGTLAFVLMAAVWSLLVVAALALGAYHLATQGGSRR